MTFSDEMKNLINTNVQKIQEWIETEIVPNIYETIRIKFFDTISSSDAFNSKGEHTLKIFPKGDFEIEFTMGEEPKKLQVAMSNTGRGWALDSHIVRNGAYELVLNWKTYKEKILAQVADQTRARANAMKALNNFEI